MPQYKILVAGAGLGGLAAASCLMKAGHQVAIYEQAPALAEVGAGIQVSANAMHVLRDLGMESDIARIGVRSGAQVDLTPVEQRIAALVAQGCTNREIAASLSLSRKTVEANLSRSYRKLGVRSRAELVARLSVKREPTPTPGATNA